MIACKSRKDGETLSQGQNVPGPPPAFPIVWEVGPGNKANYMYTLLYFFIVIFLFSLQVTPQ